MAANFFWYELMTTDVPAAEAFYTKVVGWTAQAFPGSDMEYTVVNAGERGVGGLMLLPEEAKAMGAPPMWMGYIFAADVDKATASAKQAGATVHREPTDIPGVGRFSVMADPQGASFNLLTPMGPDQPPVAPGTPGHAGWHELYTTDPKQAFDFYSGQFAWTHHSDFDMGEMGLYAMYAAGGDAASGGMMKMMPGVPVPSWLFYFNVPDIEAAAKRITDNGGAITMGPMEVPGGSQMVMATDPQGAHFALVQQKV